MANSEDVVVKFRADVSESISEMDRMKQSVVNTGKAVEQTNTKIQTSTKKVVSGFNGLGHSINQLSRELPAFAVSANVGFLALSNNIPMLADEINKLKAKNIELVASGQKSIPVWKSVTSALFGWQTLLSIGVTLLTIYGAKLAEALGSVFKLNKELKASVEISKALNDVNVKGTKNAVDEKVKIDLLFKSIKDINLTREEQLSAVQDLMATYPQYFKGMTEEQVLVSDLSAKYDMLSASILKKAKAQVAYEKIVEGEKKILELQAELVLAQEKANSAIAKDPTRNVLSGSGLTVIGKESNPLYEQAQANLKSISNEIKVIEEINKKLSDTAGGLFTDPNKNKGGGAGSARIKELKGAYAELVSKINDQETKIKDTLVETGIVSDADMQRLKDLQVELLTVNTVYDIMENGIKEVEDEMQKVDIIAGEIKSKIADVNVEAEKTPDHIKNWVENFEDAVPLITDITNNIAQITANMTQTQIDGVDAYEKAQIESLDRLLEKKTISEDEYQKRRANIEKKADVETLKLKREQAEREKIIATFQATIQGALAILKVSGEPFLLPLTIAAVATQIAAIQTAPIPQFGDGGHVKGKLHSQGGVLAELEGGEFVNKRKSVSLYREYLEGANDLKLKEVINKNDVIPALRKQREKILSNISSNFNDGNILNSDRETRGVLRDIYKEIKNGKRRNNLRFKNV